MNIKDGSNKWLNITRLEIDEHTRSVLLVLDSDVSFDPLLVFAKTFSFFPALNS